MKIALVSDYYYPDLGGMPEHVHHLGCELAQSGHDVTVITTRFLDAPPFLLEAPPRFSVVRLGRASGALIENGSVSRAAIGLGLKSELLSLFAQKRFDVIHVHAPIFPTLALLTIACAPSSALLIGTLHAHFTDSKVLRFFRRPLQRYLDALDGVIAVSKSALDSMRRIGFVCDATIIPNGVSLNYWQSGARLPAFSDGLLNLLVQARLEPRNHVGTVISALRHLPALQRQKTRLIVIGDGPERARLQKESAGLQVSFVGAQLKTRPDFAASSDIYCFTAAIASHPMSLLEGMGAGLPILCHDIDGARQLVNDGVEGHILPLEDEAAYAAALSGLLSDANRRKKMGAAAKKRAAVFDWSNVAAAIVDYYQGLIRARSERRSAR